LSVGDLFHSDKEFLLKDLLRQKEVLFFIRGERAIVRSKLLKPGRLKSTLKARSSKFKGEGKKRGEQRSRLVAKSSRQEAKSKGQ
jgi:hypothetical protein